MLDWRRVVQDQEGFKQALQSRKYKAEEAEKASKEVARLAADRIKTQTRCNELQAERNKLSLKVSELMKGGKKSEATTIIDEGKKIGAQIEALEKEMNDAESSFAAVLELIPNWPDKSVPVGTSAAENVIAREWGTKRSFDFTPKSHDELGEQSAQLDFKRAGKISGARFAFLRAGYAQLERALANYMIDLHRPKGYQEISPPYMVTAQTMYGMGQLPKFKEDLFKIEGQDKYLIPTAEVPVTSLFADEILTEDLLPQKFVAFSPCFRAEAGSYGVDTKGLIRQHQFLKVELVKFAHPEKSMDELEAMVGDAEAVLRGLEIPYRTMLLCTGDMGQSACKTYDIEVWLPGSVFGSDKKGCYREISSCSNMSDYQARRSGIRFKPKGGKGTQFVHTLNGSALAVGRCLIAVLENYQNKDGSVTVPKVLLPYMNGLAQIPAQLA